MRQLFIVAGLIACATEPERASIAFQVDAPTCGAMRVERKIDDKVVASDVITPGITTAATSVSVGSHTVSARMLYFDGSGPVYVWPDTTYVLARGDSVTRILPLYCS